MTHWEGIQNWFSERSGLPQNAHQRLGSCEAGDLCFRKLMLWLESKNDRFKKKFQFKCEVRNVYNLYMASDDPVFTMTLLMFLGSRETNKWF